MLRNVLDRYDFTTHFCVSGNEALEQLQNQHYDLVCAGYHLSDMSGESFCQLVRSIHDCQNTRIILFTAEDNQELLKRALLDSVTGLYNRDAFDKFAPAELAQAQKSHTPISLASYEIF